MRAIFFFFNDTATTEIYTLSLTTLFRSVRVPRDAGRAGATVEIGGTPMRRWPRPRCAHRHERDRRTVYRGPRVCLPAGFRPYRTALARRCGLSPRAPPPRTPCGCYSAVAGPGGQPL